MGLLEVTACADKSDFVLGLALQGVGGVHRADVGEVALLGVERFVLDWGGVQLRFALLLPLRLLHLHGELQVAGLRVMVGVREMQRSVEFGPHEGSICTRGVGGRVLFGVG